LLSISSFSIGYITSSKPSILYSVGRATPNEDSVDVKFLKSNAQKWELGRFLKTLAYYDVLKPRLKFLEAKISALHIPKGFILWNPTNQSILKWGPLDDVVMGGRSKSNIEPGILFDGNWTGYATTDGGGGFAGIRTKSIKPIIDASSCEGIEIKVTGNGQRFKLILRCDEEWNGIAWSSSFDTINKKSIKIRFPFNKLRPTKLAKTLSNKTFDSSRLTGIQFSYSKFEYDGEINPTFRNGPFNLKLEEIKSF
jgi:hypothetical protein